MFLFIAEYLTGNSSLCGRLNFQEFSDDEYLVTENIYKLFTRGESSGSK